MVRMNFIDVLRPGLGGEGTKIPAIPTLFKRNLQAESFALTKNVLIKSLPFAFASGTDTLPSIHP
jgi:hypothetical protein